MIDKFSVGGEISNGWQIFKKSWKIIYLVLAISAGVGVLNGAVTASFQGNLVATGVTTLIFWVLQIVVSIGLIKVAILLVDNQEAKVSELYTNYPIFLNYLFLTIILGAIIMAGFILFVLPGIYLAVRLQFTPYFLIDGNKGPFEALSTSWNKTKGMFWSLLIFDIAIGLLNLAGLLLLGIGVLVTAPVTMVAMASVYRKISAS